MDFKRTELTEQVAQTARDFAQQHIKPHIMEWDEAQTFPVEMFKEMGKLGLMGVFIPEEYGGAGLGYFEYSEMIQEMDPVLGGTISCAVADATIVRTIMMEVCVRFMACYQSTRAPVHDTGSDSARPLRFD